MKNIFHFAQSILTKLLGVLLSLVGTYSCHKDKDSRGDEGVAYGTPSASYVFKGTVTDENGLPIKDVRIAMLDEHQLYSVEDIDLYLEYGETFWFDFRTEPSYTNEDGQYLLIADRIHSRSHSVRLLFSTEDFTAWKDTIIHHNDLTFEGKESWYDGKAEAVINITLKKRESETFSK